MGVLGNSWSSVRELAILLGVCLIHDCARVANGEPSKITNWQVFFEKQHILFVYSGISILSWFFKGANLFDISFCWIYAFVSVVFCAALPFPRVLHYKSLAENPWPRVLLKMKKHVEADRECHNPAMK